ncbi:MAG: hypothetical protein ACJAV0_001683, partial [Shewanella sp.]
MKILIKWQTYVLILLTCTCGVAVAQQSVTEAQLQQAQEAGASDRVDLSQYIQSGGNSTGRSKPINVPSSSGPMPAGEEGLPPPFGANLFQGGFESERSDG